MKQWVLRTKARQLSLLVVMASFIGALLWASLGNATSLPVWAAPAVPVPVVLDPNVEEWSVGAGLAYWAYNCFGEEIPTGISAELFRIPTAGGPQTTLASEDASNCITFEDQVSTADGVYFFNQSLGQGRIERQTSTTKTVKTLTSEQFPFGHFDEAGPFLYWAANSGNKILRVHKNGSGNIETVADTTTAPFDVMVVGNTVYWTEKSGVWLTNITCATLPCTNARQKFADFDAKDSGYGLVFQNLPDTPGQSGNYRVYWVQRTENAANNNTYKVRYHTCNQSAACVELDATSGHLKPEADTFYTSTTNFQIGDLLLVGNNLFWTERDNSTLNNGTGDVKRKFTLDLALDVETLATNQANIDTKLYLETNFTGSHLFFARLGNGIYTLRSDSEEIKRDFVAVNVEVTQGIQNMFGFNPLEDVPLVANKTTFVRFYGVQASGPAAPNVEARLIGTKNLTGEPLPGSPLQAINPVRALTSGGSFDRAKLNDSWNFLLPASWTEAGAITLRLEIDPRHMHNDPDRNNNMLIPIPSFQTQPPVCVWTVPVRTHTALPHTYDPNFYSMVDQFERRWPIPDVWILRDTDPVEELELCWAGPFPYPCHGPYELNQGWGITNGIPDRDKVILSLWTRAQLTFNPDFCDDIGAPVHFMGMVHPAADTGYVAGYASLISNQSWVKLPARIPNPMPIAWDKLFEGGVMSQELAHNYGRKHINCGNPDNIDGNYPYPPCQISNVDANGNYGFDIASLQPIAPNAAADFMSYAYRTWVSDYTWRALFGSFVTSNVAATPLAADEGESVFVAGLVDMANTRGQISSLLILPTTSVPLATRQTLSAQATSLQPEAVEHGEEPHAIYSLHLLDPEGTLILTRTLTLTPIDDHSPDSEDAVFSDLFAKPDQQVATIQLYADNTLLDTREPGIHTPTVTVQQPIGDAVIDNQLTIQWTANDADPDDRLLFTVQYSHDNGASWHTVALDVPSTPDPVTTLPLNDIGSLHGSEPNTARIRVLASDGYNTAIATSQPFTLKNRPPEPVINVPVAGQSFAAAQPVLLQGRATDAEDGGLPESALIWQVDGDNAGSGPDVTAGGLSTGSHSAALAATDSNSQTVTATVTFDVAPLSVPLDAAPALDGFCEDASYSIGASLQLKPYSDNTQADVRVLRSDDYLWVCFSGLKKGALDPGDFVGVRADINNSRDPLAQPDDAGFFAGENGDIITATGAIIGDIDGPESLVAQVSAITDTWSAELRIDKGALGGWDHLVGLSFAHYSVTAGGDDYPWPYRAGFGQPNTWATAALGNQPLITELDPYTATLLGPSFTLTVEGSSFVSGTVVLWNGDDLPTTYITGEQITAQVTSAQLSSAAIISVTTRSPAPGNFESNALPFVVEALTPVISNLSPDSVVAESPTITLSVNGENFAPDAQVLWDGTPLVTHFVNSKQVKVEIDATLLANGQTAGIAVSNPQPDERISLVAPFDVLPVGSLNQHLFLPMSAK